MKVVFKNLNNNDYHHSIIFISLTTYSSGAESILVLFDGIHYTARVGTDEHGHKSFKRYGKIYYFEIVKE